MNREAWERARSAVAPTSKVELYERSSRRVRVSIDARGGVRFDHGADEGLAARVHDPSSKRLGFAATSGSSASAATWVARRAAADAIPYDGGTPWAAAEGHRTDQVSSSREIPRSDVLAEWLSGALARSGARPAEDPWVEASTTEETAWTEGGGWVRSRMRVWAVLVAPCVGGPDVEPIPRIVAARDPARLPLDPWPTEGRASGSTFEELSRRGEESIVFDGDSLAALVPALVATLANPPAHGDAHVGPGWVVSDDPLHPEALVGGAWDDAGFPASPLRLADGRTLVGRIHGPGSLRRGSFRDPPEPAASLLRVDPPSIEPPSRGLRVRALRIHALDGVWVLEADGTRIVGGEPGPSFSRGYLRIHPWDLAARCAGGIGPPALRAGAVLTPALRLDGLRLEG